MDIKTGCDSSVTGGNGSCTLRCRRSASASIGAESTAARSCDKCEIRFAKSKSENHYEGLQSKCAACRLLREQKTMRKWWTFCVKFVVAVITKVTPDQEVNISDNCSIHDNSRSGSVRDHIVNITNASIQNQIDQTHQVQHNEIHRQRIIRNTTFKVTGSQVKFVCRLINVLTEIVQVILSQINGSNKLTNAVYWKVTLLISSVCFIVSVVELVAEIRVSGAKWGTRDCCCWFYYPGTQGRLFGNRFLYFGVGSSGIQFIINLITVVKKKKSVKFELAPLFLSILHLICYNESFHCTYHGCALECPQCVSLYRGNEHDSDHIL